MIAQLLGELSDLAIYIIIFGIGGLVVCGLAALDEWANS